MPCRCPTLLLLPLHFQNFVRLLVALQSVNTGSTTLQRTKQTLNPLPHTLKEEKESESDEHPHMQAAVKAPLPPVPHLPLASLDEFFGVLQLEV